MNTYTKTLSELNKQNQDLKLELYDLEKQIGHKLVTEENNGTEAELKTEYLSVSTLLNEKKSNLETLKTLENKIDESESEISQEKKNIQESEKNLDSLLLDLGTSIFENYNSDLASVFGVQYNEINQIISNIEDLQVQKETLKAEMEKQGFFSKLMTQTKIAGINMSISSQTKKKEDMLKKGAKICLDNEVVTQENGGEYFSECSNLKVAIESSNNRIKFLTEEISNAKSRISELEKESKLNQVIQETSNRLDGIANQIGHAFGKQYVTRDAEILLDFPKNFEEELKEVLRLKKELKIVNRNCEIVQLLGQIKSVEENIKSLNDDVEANKKKIDELKEKNKNLAKKISEAETAKTQLQEKKAALEEEAKADGESVEG